MEVTTPTEQITMVSTSDAQIDAELNMTSAVQPEIKEMSMDVREAVEMDTEESENVSASNVLDFLLPPGTVPENCSGFGVMYNKKVLDGWVKQPSACCGAAAVAGAWNSLANFHRSDERALTHETVLKVYRQMFVDLITKKQKSFERRLGAPVEPLLEMIKQGLTDMGRTIGGPKAAAANKKSIVAVLKALVRKHIAETAATAEKAEEADKEEEGERGVGVDKENTHTSTTSNSNGKENESESDKNENGKEKELTDNSNSKPSSEAEVGTAQESESAPALATAIECDSESASVSSKMVTFDETSLALADADKENRELSGVAMAVGSGRAAAMDLASLPPRTAVECIKELFELDGVDVMAQEPVADAGEVSLSEATSGVDGTVKVGEVDTSAPDNDRTLISQKVEDDDRDSDDSECEEEGLISEVPVTRVSEGGKRKKKASST